MKTNWLSKLSWKHFVALLLIGAALNNLVACGRSEDRKPEEDGVRITSVDAVGYGNMGTAYGRNLNVTVQDDSYTMSFQIAPTTSVNYSNSQYMGNKEYTLQSLCTDTNCRQMAFLVLVKQYSGYANNNNFSGGIWNTGTTNMGTQTNQYSRAFLFRMNSLGRLERVNVVNGYFTDVSQAVGALGVYNYNGGWY